MIAEDDVKALAVEVIEELKMLLSQRADALTLEYSYRKVEKILRRLGRSKTSKTKSNQFWEGEVKNGKKVH